MENINTFSRISNQFDFVMDMCFSLQTIVVKRKKRSFSLYWQLFGWKICQSVNIHVWFWVNCYENFNFCFMRIQIHFRATLFVFNVKSINAYTHCVNHSLIGSLFKITFTMTTHTFLLMAITRFDAEWKKHHKDLWIMK